MNNLQNFSLFFLRVSLGWMFMYSGITKILNSSWSAAGYLENAKMFPELFAFFLQSSILPYINLLNEWGQLLIGVALILGIFVRWASLAGVVLMVLYYLPILDFPYPNAHSYIVDEHIIYIAAFLVLAGSGAGKIWGLEHRFSR